MEQTQHTLSLAELQAMPLPEDYEFLTGPLKFTMMNDAMFHIVLEANPNALKAFLCSSLHLSPDEITSIEVKNPIEFGNSVYSKNFILDLRLLLNNHVVIDLEMQVENLSYWKDRSLGYLCRAFDNLNEGDSYLNTKPAIHIGILNFTLFPDAPEFYATYHLSNDLTHKKYSDNLRLSVLQLKNIDLATEEDISWGLDLWAKFFKSTTWEEIRMLAEQNSAIADAAKTLYRVSEDERVRLMCEARREGEKTHRTMELLHQMKMQQIQDELQQAQGELQQTQDELQQAQGELQQAQSAILQRDEEIARLHAELLKLTQAQN